jgi:hypothetical protein
MSDITVDKLQVRPSETPHTLPPHIDKKPFLQPRAIRAFTTSALVAVGCAGAVYYAVARSMDSSAAQQRHMVRGLIPPPPVVEAPPTAVPTFVAPSAFGQLAAQLNTPPAAVTAPVVVAAPLLHQEVTWRLKGAWNNGIEFAQFTVESAAVAMTARRAAALEAGIIGAVTTQYPAAQAVILVPE